MKHTVESLMSLAKTLAVRYYDVQKYHSEETVSDYQTFHNGLHTALTEVLADLEKHRELLVKHLAVIDPLRAERDTLQAKCDEQAREIERLTASFIKANNGFEEFERKWYLACDERDTLAAKVAAMESQGTQHFSNLSNQAHGYNLTGAVPAVLNAGVTHQVSYLTPGAAPKPCAYFSTKGFVCNKCGQDHDDPIAQAAPAAQKVEDRNPDFITIPVEYQYEYPDGYWRCSNGESINGLRPVRSRALYARKDSK